MAAREGFQQHFARRLHYDLRLEIDGVLVSWAVTRGPSANPRDKRLAVRTEDHPLSYGSFEGVIPKPQYGGGTVVLWESCEYKTLNGPAAKGLAEGHIKFEAMGQRMRGAWALVRMKFEGKAENWLLVKDRDAYAEADDSLAGRYNTGVKSGLTAEQITTGMASLPATKAAAPKPRQGGPPEFIPPQLCDISNDIPEGDGKKAVKEIVGQLFDVVKDTIAGGKLADGRRSISRPSPSSSRTSPSA